MKAQMRALIGVDIGTQGTKTAVFDEAGNCLASAFRASNLIRPRAGHVEENPDEQLDAVCKTIKQSLAEAKISPSEVAGLAIDGQMAGVIGIGKNGDAVTPYDSWLDTRCNPEAIEMREQAGRKMLAQAGCAPSINHAPKILWWKKHRPRDFAKIASFVQPSAYAAMKLCAIPASEAFIDTTYLHFTGFARNASSTWDEKLCQQFGIDPAKLPAIVKPEKIVGEISSTMAKRCGLKPGTPVAAGCGDTAASFLAAGATREGICVDVAGTASVFAATISTFAPDTQSQTLAVSQSVLPSLWHAYAYINGGGMNLEWIREHILPREKGAPRVSLKQTDSLAQGFTDDELAQLPIFVPHMEGRVSPNQPGLRGAWTNLNWSHRPVHLYRAALEGVALEYAIYKRILLALSSTKSMQEIRVTGGGAASSLWNSIKADVLQTPVRPVFAPEGAPRGAAMLAGWATGVIKNLSTASKTWSKPGEAVKPNRKLAAHYANRLERYESLLRRLDPSFEERS